MTIIVLVMSEWDRFYLSIGWAQCDDGGVPLSECLIIWKSFNRELWDTPSLLVHPPFQFQSHWRRGNHFKSQCKGYGGHFSTHTHDEKGGRWNAACNLNWTSQKMSRSILPLNHHHPLPSHEVSVCIGVQSPWASLVIWYASLVIWYASLDCPFKRTVPHELSSLCPRCSKIHNGSWETGPKVCVC